MLYVFPPSTIQLYEHHYYITTPEFYYVLGMSRMLEKKMSKSRKKSLACTLCEKSFGDSRTLMNHINAHMAKKPFKCVYCDQDFSRRAHMERHVVTVHTGGSCFECDDCGVSYTNKKMMSEGTSKLVAKSTSKKHGQKLTEVVRLKASETPIHKMSSL